MPAQTSTSDPALGGYRLSHVDMEQFSGVALEAVVVTRAGHLLGIGDSISAEGPTGSPRQPSTWTSEDGLSWTRQPDSLAFASKRAFWDEGVRALIQTAGGFVAVGTESQEDASLADAAAWFSPDGRTWTRATVPDGIGRTMDEVVATTHGLVAFGEAAYSFHAGFGGGTAIWTSPDGGTWTYVSDKVGPPHGTRLRRVVSRPGGFLATAAFEWSEGLPDTPRPAVTSGIWTSSDAIHWQPISGTPLGLGDLIQAPNGYVAVGSGVADASANAIAWRSTDGLSWAPATLPMPADLSVGSTDYVQRVASGPAGLLAFGERDDDFSETGWTSSDGVTWTTMNIGAVLDGAVVDDLFPIGDSRLLSGHVDRSGTWEPEMWLLRP